MLKKDDLLEAYQALTNCCYPVWNWKFDCLFNVIKSDCPNESLFKTLFLADGRRDAIEAHLSKSLMPLVCMVQPMLSWVMAFEAGPYEQVVAIYIKGPFFSGYNDSKSYSSILRPLKMTSESEEALTASLKTLPMLTSSSIMQLALMLHYCLHDTHIKIQDVLIHTSKMSREKSKEKVTTDQFHGTSGYWDIENEIMNRVRNGDLNIGELMERAAATPTSLNDANEKSLDLYKQNIHLLLTLVSRAAVEGGLSRKSSFSLCANYRKDLNKCQSVAEVAMLSHDMMIDYVQRVNKLKKYHACSSQIRLCCEYIDAHLEEKLTLASLAQVAGYSEYYLSRKFKKEMQISIVDYIQNVKLERAKYLLANTQAGVNEISDRLGFGSRSYFTSVFKKYTGTAPSDYRKEHGVS